MTKDERAVDRELKRLVNRLNSVYKKTFDELTVEADHYFNGWNEPAVDKVTGKAVFDELGNRVIIHHAGMYERYQAEYEAFKKGKYHDPNGVYTDQQMFDRWWYSQEGRGNRWLALRDRMAGMLTHTNEIAAGMVGDKLNNVFAISANGVTDIVQKSAIHKGIVGIRFDIIDEHAVKAIVRGSTKPIFRIPKIDPIKDKAWNTEKLDNALLQGILQGDELSKIADRFQTVENMNRVSAIRNARTCVTNAQNAGKQYRFDELAKQGAIVTKQWNDVHDSMPPERQAHWDAHSQVVDYDQPFEVGGEYLMFPGDASLGASGWNLYNCRCQMKVHGVRFVSILDPDTKVKAGVRFVNI